MTLINTRDLIMRLLLLYHNKRSEDEHFNTRHLNIYTHVRACNAYINYNITIHDAGY